MNPEISFTQEDWNVRRKDYLAWWRGELKRPLVVPNVRKEGFKATRHCPRFFTSWGLETPVGEIIATLEENLSGKLYYGDSFPTFWPNYGPGVAAAFTGLSALHYDENTVWFNPKELKPLSEIRVGAPMDNPWFLRVKDVVTSAVNHFGSLVQVGTTDLGGNLDILASFRETENLLMDLVDCPEEVERTIRETHDTWWKYYDAFWDIVKKQKLGSVPWAASWAPGRTYMLQCDFCYMISPAMFERFVLPELAACCKKLDYSFYHLDGPGELNHLDLLLSIPELHGVQWIPGDGKPPAAHWPEVLDKIRAKGKLVQIHCSADEALAVIRRNGGEGYQFLVGGALTAAEAEKFLREVEKAWRGR